MVRRQLMQEFDRTSGILRPSWTGRDHDRVGSKSKARRHFDLVAANHARQTAQPTKVAGQVVDERIVIIEKKDHG